MCVSAHPNLWLTSISLSLQFTALCAELVLDAMDPDLVLHLEASNLEPEYTVTRDPFYDTSCMEGSELDLLLAACPKLQHLTLNCVLQRGCGQLQRFLFDAKVRRLPAANSSS